MAKVFEKQPLASPGSVKNYLEDLDEGHQSSREKACQLVNLHFNLIHSWGSSQELLHLTRQGGRESCKVFQVDKGDVGHDIQEQESVEGVEVLELQWNSRVEVIFKIQLPEYARKASVSQFLEHFHVHAHYKPVHGLVHRPAKVSGIMFEFENFK